MSWHYNRLILVDIGKIYIFIYIKCIKNTNKYIDNLLVKQYN